jgi:hypothetical protein
MQMSIFCEDFKYKGSFIVLWNWGYAYSWQGSASYYPFILDYTVAQWPHMYPPVAQESPFLHFWGNFDFPVTLFYSIIPYPILTCTQSLKRIHPCFQHANQIQTNSNLFKLEKVSHIFAKLRVVSHSGQF